jgi:hypothetical protein
MRDGVGDALASKGAAQALIVAVACSQGPSTAGQLLEAQFQWALPLDQRIKRTLSMRKLSLNGLDDSRALFQK